MTNSSLLSQLLTGPNWPFVWAIILIAFVIGVLVTWLIWRGKVNHLDKKLAKEKALTLQYETQLKKTEEELELKESDLKKAGLANIKLNQDLEVMAAKKEDYKVELAVSKDKVKDVSSLNQQHKQNVEDLENQILGLKTKNADLTSKVENGISANTNVEVYTLKTKLTRTNAELATAKVTIKNLEEEREKLRNATPIVQENSIGKAPVEKVVRKAAVSKKEPEVLAKAAPKNITAKKVLKTTRKVATPKSTTAAKATTKKATATKANTKNVEKERLRKVEGIGPKIEELLHNSGIFTFKQLSKTKADKLRKILEEGGSRYKMHDPTTWPEQSAMAAKGEWEKLKTYQDFLKGGVDTSKK